jgi:hypothetical protein
MTDLDALIQKLDSLTDDISRTLSKRTQHFSFSHDDGQDGGDDDGSGDGDNGSYPDTWSEHADASADGNNADLEDDGDDGDGEEDDGQLPNISKASINEYLRENDENNRPGSLEHSSHTSSSNSRHKFEALALKIKNESGIPMSSALAQCRMQFPEVYQDFQRWRRNGSNGIGKRGPATFEDLVALEQAKGLNKECAMQRVAQARGFRAFDHRSMGKSEAVAVLAEDQLMRKAEDIYQNSELNRCESLRAARLQSPRGLMKSLR